VFPHGAVEIYDTKNGNEFKVNGQCLKQFLESVQEVDTSMSLLDPKYQQHNITSFYIFFLTYMHSYIEDNV